MPAVPSPPDVLVLLALRLSSLVEVDEIDAPPLVGTALLQGHELRVKFVVGGSVTIEALP